MIVIAIWLGFLLSAILLWRPLADRPIVYALTASFLLSPNFASYPGVIPGFFVALPFLACLPSHFTSFPGSLILLAGAIPSWLFTSLLVGYVVEKIRSRRKRRTPAPGDK